MQSVTCLTVDPRVASSIPVRSHTLAEIDPEIISTTILLPSTDSRRLVVSYKQKYVHEILVNCFVELAQEKAWLCEHDHLDMTIAVDSNQTNYISVHPSINFVSRIKATF